MTLISRILITAAAISLSGGLAMAQEGVYTADQAAMGKQQYNANCAACHGSNLEGIDAPALSGLDFLGNWATAANIHGYFSVAMPPTAPGQLGDEAYVNILAYIMSFNGIPAGETELTSDPDELASINLVALAQQPASAAEAPTEEAPSADVPQAFTFGKPLPGYDPPAATASSSAPSVPQAFTFGKDLPVAGQEPSGDTSNP